VAALRKYTQPREADDFDQVDVPATVVCAVCGDVDCPGFHDERSRSGIVAVIAWERPDEGVWKRLWTTARATTLECDAFFAILPDGPVAPAFRFAVICELLAVGAMLLAAVPFAAIVAPGWLTHLAVHDALLVVRLVAVGLPALAALLVAAHAAHGVALDRGARRSGVQPKPGRALRFGLYAAGWDLVVGPIGAVVLAVKEGWRSALALATAAVGLPTRSAQAFLRGTYRLEGKNAEGALRLSYTVAIVATILGAIAVLTSAVAIALL
jgi:hypothetical protein